MKAPIIQHALLVAFAITFFIPSCKEKTEFVSSDIDRSSSASIENNIASDPVWLEMTDISQKYSDLIVALPNIDEALTTDVQAFCNAIHISIGEYQADAIKMKALSANLIEKYQMNLGHVTCHFCNETAEQKLTRAKNNFKYLQDNPNQYTAFYESVRYKESEGGGNGTGTQGPECGASFYLCCAVCAATIEIFPVYLACCGVCLKEYCKNPPSWL